MRHGPIPSPLVSLLTLLCLVLQPTCTVDVWPARLAVPKLANQTTTIDIGWYIIYATT